MVTRRMHAASNEPATTKRTCYRHKAEGRCVWEADLERTAKGRGEQPRSTQTGPQYSDRSNTGPYEKQATQELVAQSDQTHCHTPLPTRIHIQPLQEANPCTHSPPGDPKPQAHRLPRTHNPTPNPVLTRPRKAQEPPRQGEGPKLSGTGPLVGAALVHSAAVHLWLPTTIVTTCA